MRPLGRLGEGKQLWVKERRVGVTSILDSQWDGPGDGIRAYLSYFVLGDELGYTSTNGSTRFTIQVG